MDRFSGRTAIITGAGSGFGLEVARLAARQGMSLVLADVQQDALDRAAAELQGQGTAVLAMRVDVSKAAEVEALGRAAFERFGAPHLVFNNAGVGCGGLIWESTAADWEWVLGVNLMGVAHGIRVFTPMMLAAAQADAGYEGHIVNTASMAGLQNMPNMGVYNAGKHAVVSMSETLHHDLALVTDRIAASVLCPYFIPTGIAHSHRNRPDAPGEPTQSQRVAGAMMAKAVSSAKVTAAEVAQLVFDAVGAKRFYVYSHPQMLATVRTRMDDLIAGRNPTDPFAERPDIGEKLRVALRGDG